jgi:hypothetical protein
VKNIFKEKELEFFNLLKNQKKRRKKIPQNLQK